MFDETNQRMEQLIPDSESIQMLNELMGIDVEPRRNFVFNEIDFSSIRE